MVIYTSNDMDDADFDGHAHISLSGLHGTSDETELVSTSGQQGFAKGSAEEFVIKAADVGSMTACSLRMVSGDRCQGRAGQLRGSVCMYLYCM